MTDKQARGRGRKGTKDRQREKVISYFYSLSKVQKMKDEKGEEAE